MRRAFHVGIVSALPHEERKEKANAFSSYQSLAVKCCCQHLIVAQNDARHVKASTSWLPCILSGPWSCGDLVLD